MGNECEFCTLAQSENFKLSPGTTLRLSRTEIHCWARYAGQERGEAHHSPEGPGLRSCGSGQPLWRPASSEANEPPFTVNDDDGEASPSRKDGL